MTGWERFRYLIDNVINTSEKLSPKDTKTPQSISLVSVMTADSCWNPYSMLTPSNSLTEMKLSGTDWKRIYDKTFSQKCRARDFVPLKWQYSRYIQFIEISLMCYFFIWRCCRACIPSVLPAFLTTYQSKCEYHGLMNYIDTTEKCRHLRKLTSKVTLRQVFIRVYNLLSGTTLPPSPLPYLNKNTIQYTYTVQCVRGGGGNGPETDKHLPQNPFTAQFF